MFGHELKTPIPTEAEPGVPTEFNIDSTKAAHLAPPDGRRVGPEPRGAAPPQVTPSIPHGEGEGMPAAQVSMLET